MTPKAYRAFKRSLGFDMPEPGESTVGIRRHETESPKPAAGMILEGAKAEETDDIREELLRACGGVMENRVDTTQGQREILRALGLG